MANNRHRQGLQALASVWSAKAGENIPAGALVYIKAADGLAYVADKDVHAAIGVCFASSSKLITEAVTDSNTAVLRAGERFDIQPFAIFTTDTALTGEIGAPIYLSDDGEFTETAPTVVDEIVQIVGYIIDKYAVRIVLDRIEYTVVTA